MALWSCTLSGKKAEEKEIEVQEALEAFTAGAVEVLPKLLAKFQVRQECHES